MPTPLEFKALISTPTSSMCGNFINTLLKFPVLFYQWITEVAFADGTLKGAVKIGDYIFSASPSAEDDSRKLCNGQELVRADYPELFALIGVTYGTPSSGLVFKLPDRRGRMGIGVGSLADTATVVSLGTTGGKETHQLTGDEMEHLHLTGRFRSDNDAGPRYNNWMALVTSATGYPTAGLGRVVPGESQDFEHASDANVEEPLSTDASGKFTVTDVPTGPTGVAISSANANLPDAHNNMPPYIGEYIYLRCK